MDKLYLMNITGQNKKQIILSMIMLSLVFMVLLAGCRGKTSEQEQGGTISASFIIDVYDVNERMGDADYVFVGSVVEENGTRHILDEGFPQTSYKIQVLKNIKGKLATDVAIPLEKEGGYSEIENSQYLYDDDYLPSAGDVCIFFAYADKEDDALGVFGPNSTILLESNTAKSGSSSMKLQAQDEKTQEARFQKYSKYQKVAEALDSQVVPRERERYHSKYEQ